MKKIIRHVLYKTQCQFCGTEFAFEKSDVQWHSASDNKKIMPFTSCPCCGQETPAKADETNKIKLVPEPDYEEIQANQLQEKIDEYERAFQAFNIIKDKNSVVHIAKMQQQIDTFKAALLHASERILHDNKCDMVVIDPIDDCDKHNLKTIFKFIDEHTTENNTEQPKNTNHEPQRHETTVKNEEYKKTGKTYNIYKLTRREQEGKESKQCPHLQFNIGSEYCKMCRYFVSHDHVDRTVKCSYPNPTTDPSLVLFKNNQQ